MSTFTMRSIALSALLICIGIAGARAEPRPCEVAPKLEDMDNCLQALISNAKSPKAPGLADKVLDQIKDVGYHDALLSKATEAKDRAEADLDTKARAAADADARAKAAADTAAKAKADADTLAAAVAAAKSEAEAKAKAQALEDAKAKAAVDAKTAVDARAEANSKADAEAEAKRNLSKLASFIERAEARRMKVAAEAAFDENQCGERLILCLDREGERFDPRELKPQLFAGDRLTIIVLSYGDRDLDRITLGARAIHNTVALFGKATPEVPDKGRGAAKAPTFKVVARLPTTVEADARALEIQFSRAASADDPNDKAKEKTISLEIAAKQHLVEFGLMLPFAYNRDVTARGAVQYGWEPDLAFTITLFWQPRYTGQALQPPGRRWFGVIAGADLTNPVREKRFYAGLDFSPVGGLAVDLGVALMRWEYVPRPEAVPDVLTMDLQPDKRYRGSFFFGVRMTPEVFDSVKAAFDALKQKL